MKDPFPQGYLPDQSVIAQLPPPPGDFRKIRETAERLEELARIQRNTSNVGLRLLAEKEMATIWNELNRSQRNAVGSELVYDYYLRRRH